MKHPANLLSNLGRVPYSIHLLAYPTFFSIYFLGIKPWLAKRAEQAKKDDWERIPKAQKVDPDIFSPFTPIPYHNNPELKYGMSNLNMFGYVNENHINVKDYAYKQYHNVYDENNENEYLYNWVSIHKPHGG
jgi:hypothetical protein